MIWREGPVPNRHLIVLAALSLVVYAAAQRTTRRELRPRYRTKIKAAQTALLAQNAIRDAAHQAGYDLDRTNDPWGTGLIGVGHSEITSDRGFITAKVLATNPNAAAAFVDMLTSAGVHTGDQVAIGMTGSMPGWNVAILAACYALGAEPVVITSVGASDWGANRPLMTWLDMERVLRERGVLPYQSVAASLGGGGDRGRGLSPAGRRLIREAIDRNGIPLIDASNLEASISQRMAIYKRKANASGYAAYVNVGGGVASLGGAYNSRLIRPGYSRRLPPANYPVNAVINRMSRQGVPVINLTEVHRISERFGLTTVITPSLPAAGEGTLYYKERYDTTFTLLLTVFLALVVFSVVRLDLRRYFHRDVVSGIEEGV